MAKNSIKKDQNKTSKILFVGLDNAGKTSIVLSLKGINLMSLKTFNPTRGVETSDLNISDNIYNIWDFGGQEQYRDDYLNNFNRYFKGTDKLIFVIDIQDTQRYSLALEFLQKITKKLGTHFEKIKFSIFLHKSDPNLKELYPELNDDSISNLINKIKKIIPSKFLEEIYKTSIYTVFERTNI